MLDRRELIRRGLALGMAPALLPLAGGASAANEAAPGIRRRVRLGQTGLELPDIGTADSAGISAFTVQSTRDNDP
jgi:hypothetical protein